MKRTHVLFAITATAGLALTLSTPTFAAGQNDQKAVMTTVITEFFQAMRDGRSDDLRQMTFVPAIDLPVGKSIPEFKSFKVTEIHNGKGYAPASFNNFPKYRQQVHEVRYTVTLANGKQRDAHINLIKQDGKWLVITR